MFEFIGLLGIQFLISSAIFWGLVGWSLSSWGAIDTRLGAALGAIFQAVGVAAIAIIYIAKRANNTNNSSFGAQGVQPTGAFASDPFSTGGAQASAAPFDTGAFASSGFFTELDSSKPWILRIPGAFILYGASAVSVAFVFSLFLTWFNVVGENNEFVAVNALSTGLDFWVFVSIAAIVGAVALSIKGPSRWSAILLAWIGCGWLMLSMASLTTRESFLRAVEKLFQVPNLLITSSDFSGGISNAFVYEIGSAWYVLLLNAVLLLAGAVTILVLAGRNKVI